MHLSLCLCASWIFRHNSLPSLLSIITFHHSLFNVNTQLNYKPKQSNHYGPCCLCRTKGETRKVHVTARLRPHILKAGSVNISHSLHYKQPYNSDDVQRECVTNWSNVELVSASNATDSNPEKHSSCGNVFESNIDMASVFQLLSARATETAVMSGSNQVCLFLHWLPQVIARWFAEINIRKLGHFLSNWSLSDASDVTLAIPGLAVKSAVTSDLIFFNLMPVWSYISWSFLV